MLLLTGATGLIGSRVLRRLADSGADVRCLVRDPRRLGEDRVRVQLTIGDMSDPLTFPGALRGVDTVVHMAAAIRDQRRGTIEEINGTGTWRLLQAAQTAGVKRFVFFSALGAAPDASTRFLKSKAAAEQAVLAAPLDHTIFAPSIVYANGDPLQTLLERLAILPVVPINGKGQAEFEPIWADDVADCVAAALAKPERNVRYELAGPERLSYDDIARELLAGTGKKRRFVHLPIGPVTPSLVPCLSERGTADAESLGVQPLQMREALKP